MDDRKLLELAAKAAGIKALRDPHGMLRNCTGFADEMNIFALPLWNPLTDDGDSRRLEVMLHMTVRCYMGTTVAQIGTPGLKNAYEEVTDHDDPLAAARLAVVRAAAAIGEAMP